MVEITKKLLQEHKVEVYTVQETAFLDQLRSGERIASSFDYVYGEVWKMAFRWIVLQASKRNPYWLDMDAAPIWVWHSCGGLYQTPSWSDLICLYSIEKYHSYSHSIAKLVVPSKFLLLSDYTYWNDILDDFHEYSATDEDLAEYKLFITTRELEGIEDSDELVIQGILPYINADWLVASREIDPEILADKINTEPNEKLFSGSG